MSGKKREEERRRENKRGEERRRERKRDAERREGERESETASARAKAREQFVKALEMLEKYKKEGKLTDKQYKAAFEKLFKEFNQ